MKIYKKIDPRKLAQTSKGLLDNDCLDVKFWEDENYDYLVLKIKQLDACFSSYVSDGKPSFYSSYFKDDLVYLVYYGLITYFINRIAKVTSIRENLIIDCFNCIQLVRGCLIERNIS